MGGVAHGEQRLHFSTVIQGATPLFGATLVPEPQRLLDEVHTSGVDAFDSGLAYTDPDGTCDGRLGAWVADRGVRDVVTLIGKGCHPGPPDWSASRVHPETVAVDVAAAVVFVAKSHRRALIEDLSLRPSRRRRS